MLIQEKVNQAKAVLKEMGVDCWITFARESQINGDPCLDFLVEADVTWHSVFMITSSGKAIAIVGQYDQKAVEDLKAYDIVLGYVQGIKAPLLESLKELNPARIAINYSKGSEICDGLPHGLYLTLVEFLTEIGFEKRLISAENIVSAIRQRKTKTEVERIKEAIRLTEEFLISASAFMKPGQTELEIADFIKGEVFKNGLELAWEPSVCPAVFTGPEHAGAHYNPTERTVEPGHILNIDFGVKYKGYCADLQRTFYVLQKNETQAPPPVLKGFDTIVQAIEQAKALLKPGVQGHEVDKAARDFVTSSGFEEFPHGLGHQVGRYSHDGTALLGPPWEKYANKVFQNIEEGMIFTLEPRLTVPNYGVATVENMVQVTQDGAIYLSTPQKELLYIRTQ